MAPRYLPYKAKSAESLARDKLLGKEVKRFDPRKITKKTVKADIEKTLKADIEKMKRRNADLRARF